MELLDFIRPLDSEALEGFAVRVGTTVAHLRNVAYGSRVASAALAAQIQVATDGAVQVSQLRPKDWHLVWGAAVNQTMKPSECVTGDLPTEGDTPPTSRGTTGDAHNHAPRDAA
jgi:DNA-binding transcriptional regulator YdaS (Cro superfamily)